jgi:hypothetical protein
MSFLKDISLRKKKENDTILGLLLPILRENVKGIKGRGNLAIAALNRDFSVRSVPESHGVW